jgi:ethanolaminephosphotransferase
LTFYVQTWDEYHTHVLTLGFISGPVEGILTLCFIYAATAILGGGSIGVQNYDVIPDFIYNLAWNEWYMVYGSVMLVSNTVSRCVLLFQFVHSNMLMIIAP